MCSYKEPRDYECALRSCPNWTSTRYLVCVINCAYVHISCARGYTWYFLPSLSSGLTKKGEASLYCWTLPSSPYQVNKHSSHWCCYGSADSTGRRVYLRCDAHTPYSRNTDAITERFRTPSRVFVAVLPSTPRVEVCPWCTVVSLLYVSGTIGTSATHCRKVNGIILDSLLPWFLVLSGMFMSDQRWSSCCTSLSDGKHSNIIVLTR